MANVLYEKRNRIAYITLNRPDALNALDDGLNCELWRGICSMCGGMFLLETLNAYSCLGDFSEARARLVRRAVGGKK